MSDYEPLVDSILSGTATMEERAELTDRIAANPTLRQEYITQMRLHALLQWRSGSVNSASGSVALAKPIPFPRELRRPHWLAIAAVLAALCSLGALLWTSRDKESAPVVIEVLHAVGAVVAGEAAELTTGEHRELRVLDLQSGLLRVRLTSGAILGAVAPAKIVFLNDMHVRILSGRITADAGAAHGFTVETVRTRIVDLGTRFGVDAGAQGTDVVVFDGAIELHDSADRAGAIRRLAQGEAVRIAAAGTRQPIISITAGAEPEQWSAGVGGLFRSVRDNRGTHDAPKFYQIVPGGLREDTRAYVDRTHEWNGVDAAGIPEFLRDADFVRTFNDDKRDTDLEVTVELAEPGSLYIFLDKKPPPAWVATAGFVDLGAKIGLDEGPSPSRALTTAVGPGQSIERVFSVYKLEVREPRAVKLGPPRNGPAGAKAMYGIAAQPLLK